IQQVINEYSQYLDDAPAVQEEPYLVPEAPEQQDVDEHTVSERIEEADQVESADEGEVEAADPDMVPETAGDYCCPAVPGFDFAELPEFEKPLMMGYLELLHEDGVKQGTVAKLLDFFARNRLSMGEIVGQRDRDTRDGTRAILQEEWGSDFHPNIS